MSIFLKSADWFKKIFGYKTLGDDFRFVLFDAFYALKYLFQRVFESLFSSDFFAPAIALN